MPIQADRALAAEFRRRYRGDSDLPLVGIAWGSTNKKKQLPDIGAWNRLFARVPAIYVSLQYGDVADALKSLRAGSPYPVINDPSVDQLVDMDRFAAQIAALDAVVSIDNTGAHLVGAMDKPMVLLLSDQTRSVFPLTGAESGWFPRTVVTRKEGRQWSAVMEEAAARAKDMLLGSS
jgi:hypothetical protein